MTWALNLYVENSTLLSVLCSHLEDFCGEEEGLRGERGWTAAVGTVESENLLCKGGKENLVYVKMGNINPVIFLFFLSLFFFLTIFSLARLLLLPPCSFPYNIRITQMATKVCRSLGMGWIGHLVVILPRAWLIARKSRPGA